jgi:hypothetical protein
VERVGGRIDFALRYQPETQTLRLEIRPEPGRIIPEVRYRARDPQGGRAAWADYSDASGRTARLQPEGDLFLVKSIRAAARLEVHFQ